MTVGHAPARLDALDRLGGGAVVVTAVGDGGRLLAATAERVVQVSEAPPLLLVCLPRASEALAALRRSERFAIGVPGDVDRTGRPSPDPSVTTTIECELHDVADGGDHRLVLGRPIAVEPLLPAPPEEIVAALPSRLGDLRLVGVEEGSGVTALLALVGRPEDRRGSPVHLHSACVLGDALGHLGCRAAGALTAAVDRMHAVGHGVVVYRRDDSVAFGGCCLPGNDARARAASPPSPRLRAALGRLGLADVELLVLGDDVPHGLELGLDVAVVRRWEDRRWSEAGPFTHTLGPARPFEQK